MEGRLSCVLDELLPAAVAEEHLLPSPGMAASCDVGAFRTALRTGVEGRVCVPFVDGKVFADRLDYLGLLVVLEGGECSGDVLFVDVVLAHTFFLGHDQGRIQRLELHFATRALYKSGKSLDWFLY